MNQGVETDVPSVKAGPGRLLAQLRAERKLSIADVAQRLKYGVRQIEALEAEEFDKLPGATFVRGMVRGYAKLLETDPEPVLGALEECYIPGEIDLDLRDKGIPFARTGKRGTRTYLALSVLALVVVAGELYEWRAGAFPWARFVLGRSHLSLVIGNGAAVRLTYNDKPVDLKPYIEIEVARLTLN